MNKIYKAISDMTFFSIYEGMPHKNSASMDFRRRIKTRPTMEDITFSIKRDEHAVHITDNGSTLRNLDHVYELSEPEVVANIKRVLAYYGMRKQGYELILDVRPFGHCLPQLLHFMGCIRFLYLMIIFYQ